MPLSMISTASPKNKTHVAVASRSSDNTLAVGRFSASATRQRNDFHLSVVLATRSAGNWCSWCTATTVNHFTSDQGMGYPRIEGKKYWYRVSSAAVPANTSGTQTSKNVRTSIICWLECTKQTDHSADHSRRTTKSKHSPSHKTGACIIPGSKEQEPQSNEST